MKNLQEVNRLQKLAGIQVDDFVAASNINMSRVISESITLGNAKSFNTAMMYHVVPKVINEIKKDIIRTLHTNDYFTIEERRVLCEYFNTHKTLLNESVYVNSLDEDLKSWWKSGKEKLKNVFGSVKSYIQKIWNKVKEVFAKIIEKGKSVIKPLLEKTKAKIKPAIEKIKKDPELSEELIAEVIALGEMTNYVVGKKLNALNNLDKSVSDEAAKKVEAGEDTKVADTAGKEGGEKSADGELSEFFHNRKSLVRERFVFNHSTTLHIIENTNDTKFLTEEESTEGDSSNQKKSSWPTFLTKQGWKDNWKKYLWNIFKIVLNPVMGGLGVTGGYFTELGLDGLSKIVAKLGGPPAKKFHVIPEYIFATLEIKGMYNSIFEKFMETAKPYLDLIPFGIGTAFEKLWHFGHYILIGFAVYELIKETLDTLGMTKYVRQFTKDAVSRKSKVAGPASF